MKKSCENNIEKEKYFKKILNNKVGLFLFIFFSSILVDIFIVCCLPKILKSDFFKSLNINFVLIGFLIYSLLSFAFLKCIRKIKNKYSKIGTEYRFIVDLIFIFELLILSIYNIVLLLKMIYRYLFAINLSEWNNVFIMFFTIILIIYIFNSMLKNILRISYLVAILYIFLIFLAGWISVENFGLISLIVIVINQFMSYDDVLNVYSKLKIDYDDIKVDEKNTNKQIAINKLYFNISIVFLYVYISLTEDFSIYGFIPKLSDEKVVPKLLLISFKGFNRIIIIEIIVIIYAIYLKVKKKLIKKETIKFKQKFEVILMKFIEKYIIRTK